jgi:hypothetical protein
MTRSRLLESSLALSSISLSAMSLRQALLRPLTASLRQQTPLRSSTRLAALCTSSRSTISSIPSVSRAFSVSPSRREHSSPDEPENTIDPDSIRPMHLFVPALIYFQHGWRGLFGLFVEREDWLTFARDCSIG